MIFEIRCPDDIAQLKTQFAAPCWMRNQPLVVEIITEKTGKWGMAKLWRKWMAETADWMAWRGATG